LVAVVGLASALVALGSWVLVDNFAGGGGNGSASSRQVAERFVAAMSKPDDNVGIAAVFAPNGVQIDKTLNEVMRGRDAISAGWWELHSTISDFHWHGNIVLATRDQAVVNWVMSGAGNPLNGKPFTTNGVSILDIKNGAIARETFYYPRP
jgi:ketosteroid isomerase-like protein